MLHPLQHITDLSEICYRQGAEHIVISPGSRNAPLINSFYSRFGEGCISIVDERSAAYLALGIARNSKRAVVLICTSGTAVLNYSPAIAEAYYQRIPLIVITADRPSEWIDQQDNQTIRQRDVYSSFIFKRITLPEKIPDSTKLELSHKSLVEIISSAISSQAPIHINVPLHEPLYEKLPPVSKVIFESGQGKKRNFDIPNKFISQWEKAERILLIHGQDKPDEDLEKSIKALLPDKRLVIVAENISNLDEKGFIQHPELMCSRTNIEKLQVPDLLIYAGGQLVSKKMKVLIRSWNVPNTWRIGKDLFQMDTFRQNNMHLKFTAKEVYSVLANLVDITSEDAYKTSWINSYNEILEAGSAALKKIHFSDISSLKTLLAKLPPKSIVELGNSSAIRYSQLIPFPKDTIVYSNRGVSGIDGCLSSAVGTALTTDKLVLVVLGDLSFVYDSNALWNRKLPGNLKIVVLNNSGGGIFGLIPGPSESSAFNDFFLAHHPVEIQKLTEAFNLNYYCIRNEEDLSLTLSDFLEERAQSSIMEVFTAKEANFEAFHQVMANTIISDSEE